MCNRSEQDKTQTYCTSGNNRQSELGSLNVFNIQKDIYFLKATTTVEN